MPWWSGAVVSAEVSSKTSKQKPAANKKLQQHLKLEAQIIKKRQFDRILNRFIVHVGVKLVLRLLYTPNDIFFPDFSFIYCS